MGEVVGGATPSTQKPENYEGGNISWITPKDLSNFSGRFISRGARNITEAGLRSCATRLMPKSTILFSSRAPIGYVAIAAKELCTNQGFKSVIPNDNTNFMFLYYLLKYNKNIIEHMGSGTTFREVSGNTMKNITVCVPPLDVQEKIAGILSPLDDKIELNNRINANLEAQARAIFRHMFPDITLGSRTIGEYIIPKRGKSLLSKNAIHGNVPVIAGGTKPAAYHNSANTKPPVVTIAASGTAGFVSIWHVPVWSSDSSFIDAEMTEHVYFWYLMLKTRQQEIYGASVGSVQPHIYPQHIASMTAGYIDTEKLNDFTEKVTPMFKMIGLNLAENKTLSQIRDTLLPKLLSGEIEP